MKSICTILCEKTDDLSKSLYVQTVVNSKIKVKVYKTMHKDFSIEKAEMLI